MDFSNCEYDLYKSYSGKQPKLPIKYNGKSYILKYREEDKGQPVYSDISEYIGCKIYESLGMEVQKVIQGTYNGKSVVLCENFLKKGEVLQEFSNFTNSYSKVKDKRYSFDEIINTIDKHQSIFNKEEVKKNFWRMYVVDSFLGNFDRHGGNWGFVVNEEMQYSKFSPVYDCGSCLYPQINDKEIDRILKSDYEIKRRIFEFPTSQIVTNENRTKSSYYEVINNLESDDCNKAVEWFVENIDLYEVESIIDKTENLSDKRKKFLNTMLNERYKCIIMPAYEKIKNIKEKNTEINHLETDLLKKQQQLRAYTEELNDNADEIRNYESIIKCHIEIKDKEEKY